MYRREAINSAKFLRTGKAYRSAVNGTIFTTAAFQRFWNGWLGHHRPVLALGGWMVTGGTMGLGTLTTFILASQRLFDPFVSWRAISPRFRAGSRLWNGSES